MAALCCLCQIDHAPASPHKAAHGNVLGLYSWVHGDVYVSVGRWTTEDPPTVSKCSRTLHSHYSRRLHNLPAVSTVGLNDYQYDDPMFLIQLEYHKPQKKYRLQVVIHRLAYHFLSSSQRSCCAS